MSDIITTINSTTITSTNRDKKPIEFDFVLNSPNTGKMTVSDPLLDDEERARTRAESEFLKNSYKNRTIKFSSWKMGIKQNNIVEINGLPYIIKSRRVRIQKVKMWNAIERAVRYE